MSEFIIQRVDPKDKGLTLMLDYCAMSNRTLADKLDTFMVKHPDQWKIESHEFALLGAIVDRLRHL
jgi:hypothetical protein